MQITKKAWANLKAVHAGIYCFNHRYLTEDDKIKIDSCLKGNFQELDKEKIPFKMQNIVIMLAEQKRDILDVKQYYKELQIV